jgi:hypothetical protein
MDAPVTGQKHAREDDEPLEHVTKAARLDEEPETRVHPLHARAGVRHTDSQCRHWDGFNRKELTAAFRMSYDPSKRVRTAANRETYRRLLALVKDKNASVAAEHHLDPLWYTGGECPCGYCFGLFENIRYPGPHPLDGCYWCEAPITEVNEEEDFEAERIEEVLCRACYDKAVARGVCNNCSHLLAEGPGHVCAGGTLY